MAPATTSTAGAGAAVTGAAAGLSHGTPASQPALPASAVAAATASVPQSSSTAPIDKPELKASHKRKHQSEDETAPGDDRETRHIPKKRKLDHKAGPSTSPLEASRGAPAAAARRPGAIAARQTLPAEPVPVSSNFKGNNQLKPLVGLTKPQLTQVLLEACRETEAKQAAKVGAGASAGASTTASAAPTTGSATTKSASMGPPLPRAKRKEAEVPRLSRQQQRDQFVEDAKRFLSDAAARGRRLGYSERVDLLDTLIRCELEAACSAKSESFERKCERRHREAERMAAYMIGFQLLVSEQDLETDPAWLQLLRFRRTPPKKCIFKMHDFDEVMQKLRATIPERERLAGAQARLANEAKKAQAKQAEREKRKADKAKARAAKEAAKAAEAEAAKAEVKTDKEDDDVLIDIMGRSSPDEEAAAAARKRERKQQRREAKEARRAARKAEKRAKKEAAAAAAAAAPADGAHDGGIVVMSTPPTRAS